MKSINLTDITTLLRYLKRTVAREVRLIRNDANACRFISLRQAGACQGKVLLSYILDPFLGEHGQPISHAHTNYWEAFQIAQTFLDYGFAVDVMDWRNTITIPSHTDYDVFIDNRYNMERLSPLLAQDCLRIMHIDNAHISFLRASEAQRLLALQQRRGITLEPRMAQPINYAIEYAHCATYLGNSFTKDTFRYAKKPLYRVPISVPMVYPWDQDKDFHACRRHFLWFGSRAFVHKGLDLVLEAFSEMPDYHLTVVGPVERDADFYRAYQNELYHTPNIHTTGWLDIDSPQFYDIIKNCVGVIFASAGEGGAGSVISAMHTGLVPIVNTESSVDIDDFGFLLRESSIQEIQARVQQLSELSAKDLETRSRRTWEFAREHHTRETFAEAYRAAVGNILQSRRPSTTPAPQPKTGNTVQV